MLDVGLKGGCRVRGGVDRKKYILLGTWKSPRNGVGISTKEGLCSCQFYLTKRTHAFSCHPH